MRSGADEELKELQELMLDRQPMGALISIAKTVDQVSESLTGLRWGAGACWLLFEGAPAHAIHSFWFLDYGGMLGWAARCRLC